MKADITLGQFQKIKARVIIMRPPTISTLMCVGKCGEHAVKGFLRCCLCHLAATLQSPSAHKKTSYNVKLWMVLLEHIWYTLCVPYGVLVDVIDFFERRLVCC